MKLGEYIRTLNNLRERYGDDIEVVSPPHHYDGGPVFLDEANAPRTIYVFEERVAGIVRTRCGTKGVENAREVIVLP